MSCEEVTHIVSLLPSIDTKAYSDAQLLFYIKQKNADGRLDEWDFNGAKALARSTSTLDLITRRTVIECGRNVNACKISRISNETG